MAFPLALAPFIGAGPLRFGMSVDQVRALMPDTATPFPKGDSGHPTDAFDQLGVHVFYTEDGRCEAIEMWGEAEPSYAGFILLHAAFSQARQHLTSHDPSSIVDACGLEARALGIALYCPPHEEDPSAPVQTVLACARHYWGESAD